MVQLLPFLIALGATTALSSARLDRQQQQSNHHWTRQELQRRDDAAAAIINARGSIPILNHIDQRSVFDDPDTNSSLFVERDLEERASSSSHKKKLKKKVKKSKHCSAGQKKQKKKTSSSSSSSKKTKAAAATTSTEKKSTSSKTKTSSSSHATTTKATQVVAAVTSSGGGLMNFVSSNCGSSGASASQPNGAQSFLNCGLSQSNPNSGWTPPKGITIAKLKTVSIEQALASNSVWEPCKPYISLFEKYANANGLPPILLASFAMQESTCNPSVVGDSGGAWGLMQITTDKCNGMGGSACAEPDYNIKTAAAYFKGVLDQAGGDVLSALGSYNGWYPGLTYNQAIAARWSGCCECQQNLDYLYQMLNGWLLGKTGYDIGSIQNLKVCS
ncbi:lysozyme-like protein [Meredithblackwellia eburnea MCA 4105]